MNENSKLDNYVQSYSATAALLISSAAVSYFLTYHSDLTPPVKPRSAIFAMSTIFECHAILRVHTINNKLRKRLIDAFLITSVVYFFFLFTLTFRIPTSSQNYRDAIGFICEEKFLEIHSDACYWIKENVMGDYSNEPERIWKNWTIGLVKGVLITSWLTLIWLFSATIANAVRPKSAKRIIQS